MGGRAVPTRTWEVVEQPLTSETSRATVVHARPAFMGYLQDSCMPSRVGNCCAAIQYSCGSAFLRRLPSLRIGRQLPVKALQGETRTGVRTVRDGTVCKP